MRAKKPKGPPKPQGETANFEGKLEESRVMHYLETLGYKWVTDAVNQKAARKWVRSERDIADWFRGQNSDGKLFLKGQPTIRDVYNAPWKVDFTIWDSILWPRCLFIEVKGQSVAGSVDAKFPYIVMSLKQLNRPSGAVIVGNGFKQQAIHWIEDQQTELFRVWRNGASMRNYLETKSPLNVDNIAARIVSAQDILPL